MESLEYAIRTVLNKFSAENASNTPDFILAQFLLSCLAAWDTGVQQRETWHGRDASGSVSAGGMTCPDCVGRGYGVTNANKCGFCGGTGHALRDHKQALSVQRGSCEPGSRR